VSVSPRQGIIYSFVLLYVFSVCCLTVIATNSSSSRGGKFVSNRNTPRVNSWIVSNTNSLGQNSNAGCVSVIVEYVGMFFVLCLGNSVAVEVSVVDSHSTNNGLSLNCFTNYFYCCVCREFYFWNICNWKRGNYW